jgi:hypothetical protein
MQALERNRLMRIENWKIKEQANTVEVSADVDNFHLWFRLPESYSVSRSADPFLASALLPAMRQGEELEIDPNLPVSPKLLGNISMLQEIFHTCNPEELKIIPIKATTSPAVQLNPGIMSFFSGGVDSTYTFLKHKDKISHLVFMKGMDFYTSNGESSRFSVSDLKDLARFAFQLIPPRDPVSAYLKEILSKSTLESLSKYRYSGFDPGAVEAALVNDLNEIISGRMIYEAKRFSHVKLRQQTKTLLMKNLRGEEIIDLNRLLLEDAFPLEIARSDDGTFQTAIERNTRFVQGFGKTLIPIEHNHYAFGYRYNLSRNLTQGSVLGSVALLLGFHQTYIPASDSYLLLRPNGSHPLTDPLWSNESMRIIHDGCEAERTDKLRKICECESVLANLRVCFNDQDVNCGKCAKCMRTMIPLKLLGASAAPFPSLPPLKTIRKTILHNLEMLFFKQNVVLAIQEGDKEMSRTLEACIRKNEYIQIFMEIDRVLLGGFLKRLYRKLVPGIRRIDSSPQED